MNEIRRIRTKLCMTQAELGAKLGVDGRTVARWEQGARTPTLGTAWGIVRLARQRRIGTSLDLVTPDPNIGEEI